eukprot:scaffold10919_cov38-Cyclotella_meneghiniana.AAC.1
MAQQTTLVRQQSVIRLIIHHLWAPKVSIIGSIQQTSQERYEKIITPTATEICELSTTVCLFGRRLLAWLRHLVHGSKALGIGGFLYVFISYL